MKSTFGQLCRILLLFTLTICFAAPRAVQARQSTVVTPAELRDAIQKASSRKQDNLQQARGFFADPQVRNALTKGGIQYERVQKAVSALDSDALAKLAARSSQIQADFSAGALTNQELTYIVIALAVAVVVLIAVS